MWADIGHVYVVWSHIANLGRLLGAHCDCKHESGMTVDIDRRRRGKIVLLSSENKNVMMSTLWGRKRKKGHCLVPWLHDQTICCVDGRLNNVIQWDCWVTTPIRCSFTEFFDKCDLVTSRSGHLDPFVTHPPRINVLFPSVWLRSHDKIECRRRFM